MMKKKYIIRFLGFCFLFACFPIKIGLLKEKFENTANISTYISHFFYEGWSLAFSRVETSNNGIYIYSSTGKLVEISDTFEKTSSFSNISWSPDGKQIAYMRGTSGINTNEIIISNADGKSTFKLTNGSSPSWSPDGKDLVFIRDDDIYVYNFETQKIRPLQVTKYLMESTPEWSPNGEYIAYVVKDDNRDGKLYIMEIDGSNLHRISIKESADIYSGISWSSDSTKIAFVSHKPCGDIYFIDLNTYKTSNLTMSIGDEVNPSWSPDGKSIIYSGMEPSKECPKPDEPISDFQYHVYMIDLDGSNFHEISIPFTLAWLTSPKWSPAIPLQKNQLYLISVLGDSLNLREAPSTNSRVIKILRKGTVIFPIIGPQTDSRYRWWKVQEKSSGKEGWLVEEPGYFQLTE